MRKNKNTGQGTCNREFTLLEYNGRFINVSYSAVVEVSHDSNYGADADGNRGMSMDFIDDVVVSETPKVFYVNEVSGKEVEISVANLSQKNKDWLEGAIDEDAKDIDWDCIEFECPEPYRLKE